MRKILFVGAAALASTICLMCEPAKAEFYIRDNTGGQIGAFIQQIDAIKASGEKVRIGGNCLSACTLVLAVPSERLCFEKDARLGFHAAWMPDADGRPVTSFLGSLTLVKSYPGSVRNWISRHGGLTRKMIYLKGKALRALFPGSACKGRVSPGAMAAITYTQGYQAYPPNGVGRH